MKHLAGKPLWKFIVPVVVLGILGFSFWYGGNAPGLQGWAPAPPAASPSSGVQASSPEGEAASPSATPPTPAAVPASETSPKAAAVPASGTALTPPGGDSEKPLSVEEKLVLAKKMAGEKSSAGVKPGDPGYSQKQGMTIDPSTGKDRYLTDPVPAGKPVPIEPQNARITDTAHTCTLSVRCDAILKNMSWLDPEKVELVPEGGVIFEATTVTFYEGESVFNVLQREMKKAGVHMEFENTPMYNSAYIEGIHNLYEFDCGELSGWMYKVNGWFPNYGCSRYQLKEADVIEWVYTCNLGIDVGGYYSVGS